MAVSAARARAIQTRSNLDSVKTASSANSPISTVPSSAATNAVKLGYVGSTQEYDAAENAGKALASRTAAAPAQPAFSPAVVTSDKAKGQLDTISQFTDDTKAGIRNQAVRNQNQTLQERQQSVVEQEKADASRMEQEKLSIQRQQADAKTAALAGTTGEYAPVEQAAAPSREEQANQELARENADYQDSVASKVSSQEKAYQDFSRQIKRIQNGTFPLSDAQQALVDSTAQAFDEMTEQSRLRGLALSSQTGGFSIKVGQTLGDLSNIESQKAMTLANLETGFQDKNYKMVAESYNAFLEHDKQQTELLTNLHNDIVAQAKDVRDFNIEQQKIAYQKEQDIIKNDMDRERMKMDAQRLADDLATNSLQREKIRGDIIAAKEAAVAAKNLLPKNVQANVDKIVGQFDGESIVKQYNTAAQAKSFIDQMPNTTENPSDDQALIYAFAKIMDPESVVREGEYATAKKYSQSWAKSFGAEVNQAIAGTGFLSQTARENIKNTVGQKFGVIEKQYDNLSKEYGRRIENVGAPSGSGTSYITDYRGAMQNGDEQRTQIDNAVRSDPSLAEKVSSLYESDFTDNSVYEYLKQHNAI